MSDLFAPAPTRPTATFTLMLGMVPVPLRLFTSVNDTKLVERKMFTTDGHSVGMPTVDLETNEKISRADVIYKVDVDGVWVELSDDELAHVTAGQAVDKGQVPIDTLIPLDTLHHRYRVEKTYQARPQKRKVGKKNQDDQVANKAFGLLIEALKAENVAALFRVGLRSHARYAALTPDGSIHFLHYDDEVRRQLDFPDVDISDAELGMAKQLLAGIGTSTPDLRNEAGAAIRAHLEAKAKGEEDEFVLEEAPATTAVLDLTQLLAASVNLAQAS